MSNIVNNILALGTAGDNADADVKAYACEYWFWDGLLPTRLCECASTPFASTLFMRLHVFCGNGPNPPSTGNWRVRLEWGNEVVGKDDPLPTWVHQGIPYQAVCNPLLLNFRVAPPSAADLLRLPEATPYCKEWNPIFPQNSWECTVSRP